MDTRLQSAQNALLLQEDTIRRSERERKTMLDQITNLERQLLAMDNEKKQVIVSDGRISRHSHDERLRYCVRLGKNGSIEIRGTPHVRREATFETRAR